MEHSAPPRQCNFLIDPISVSAADSTFPIRIPPAYTAAQRRASDALEGGGSMKILQASGLALALLLANAASANESTMKELNPTGKLRVALVFAPSLSLFFDLKEARRRAASPPTLPTSLAKSSAYPSSPCCSPTRASPSMRSKPGQSMSAFMPVDEERKKRIAFGPSYVMGESTYMVTAASGAKTVEEVDRAGMRVIGIANTTTIRRRRPHAEEHHNLAGDLGRGCRRGDARGQGRRVRARRATRCRPT